MSNQIESASKNRGLSIISKYKVNIPLFFLIYICFFVKTLFFNEVNLEENGVARFFVVAGETVGFFTIYCLLIKLYFILNDNLKRESNIC